MEGGKLYTVEGAAAFLGGISKWTVHVWLAKGKLRRTKVGARTMIRECDLQAFLASCNPEPPRRTRQSEQADRVYRAANRAIEGVFSKQSAQQNGKAHAGTWARKVKLV
jgi:excisionase family DNA binding protein